MLFYIYLFFSFERLSLIISICSLVKRVIPLSLAQATHPFKIVGKNILGALTNTARASSVNLTSVHTLSAAYLTESYVVCLIGNNSGYGFLDLLDQKFLESLYPKLTGIFGKSFALTPLIIAS